MKSKKVTKKTIWTSIIFTSTVSSVMGYAYIYHQFDICVNDASNIWNKVANTGYALVNRLFCLNAYDVEALSSFLT